MSDDASRAMGEYFRASREIGRKDAHVAIEVSCHDRWPPSVSAREIRRVLDALASVEGVEMVDNRDDLA
jgi:hypothetical protein